MEMPANLICFSHLRWDFVYQRPQHLLNRFARHTNVYFFEEPIFDSDESNYLSLSKRKKNLQIITPHLLPNMKEEEVTAALTKLVDQLLVNFELDHCMFWYYTPQALKFTDKHKPKIIIYDCMDELANFKFAPKEIVMLEKKLLAKADLVFTGGHSLYEAKKQYHANIFPFPSSIEKKHFAQARVVAEADDQKHISGPKIGFFGVIDERFDIDLIRDIATAKPDWQIVLIGPVVKIDPNSLPKNQNIHYLGQKSYTELPTYMAGWDVALIPFLLNESTRFISPTKTPEYLAASIPVVSSAIRDVVQPYGVKKLVHIAKDSAAFIAAIEKELAVTEKEQWLKEVDGYLKQISWDKTYHNMQQKIKTTIEALQKLSIAS
eukprot:GDKJ01004059.1.p2 GENE.GDKJ01004059.1~~GDKJ01004059.1.p2  ORF type:complete len:377 (+),score=20.48 GDKJ01004059.1:714-1844(+)